MGCKFLCIYGKLKNAWSIYNMQNYVKYLMWFKFYSFTYFYIIGIHINIFSLIIRQ